MKRLGTPATAFHERLLAELLTLQRADGTQRLAATLSEAKVDLNPHQIEAAAFALDSLARGGCVLADEVGLGKARPLPPVTYLALDPTAASPRLGPLRGKDGWWFCYRVDLTGLKPEQRLAHLVLARKEGGFVPLSPDDAALFVAVPAGLETRRTPEAPPVGAAQEEALEQWRKAAVQEAELASTVELDTTREQLDRYLEDCLSVPRHKAAQTRDAWEDARRALASAATEQSAALRAAIARAERDYRRALAALRAEEDARFAERDRQLAELTEKAKVHDHRTLVASAYWWM